MTLLRWFSVFFVVLFLALPSAADPIPSDQPVTEFIQSYEPVSDFDNGSATQAPKRLFTPIQGQQCCKICRKGKACGNSCISRLKRCTKPPGCACNG